jgi:hypothetical protein
MGSIQQNSKIVKKYIILQNKLIVNIFYNTYIGSNIIKSIAKITIINLVYSGSHLMGSLIS